MNEGASLTDLRVELANNGDLTRVPQLVRYFQAFPGGYGEGDRFQEERLTALLIMIEQYEKESDSDKRELTSLYLEQKDRVNNWDLVDTSADKLLGRSVLDGRSPESLIDELASSESLWDYRIAMLSTFAFIRAGRFELPMRIARRLLGHPEGLIHKAVGWMLREVTNRSPETGIAFLEAYAPEMPRIALRYAVERLPKEQKDRLMRQTR